MDKEIRKDGEGEVLFDIRHLTHTFETEDGKTFDALKDVTAQIMKDPSRRSSERTGAANPRWPVI